MPAAVVAVIFAIAGVAELISDSWRRPDADFFATSATVAPLVGLALFVELVLVWGPIIDEQGLTPENEATARAAIRMNATMLVLSVAAALYALGSHRHTAFLVVLSTAPWLVQLFLLVATAYNRIGINWVRGGRQK